jgi:hypothetical protein
LLNNIKKMVEELTSGEFTVLPSFLAQLYRQTHILLPDEEEERKVLISVLRGEDYLGSSEEESDSEDEESGGEQEQTTSPDQEEGLRRSPHWEEPKNLEPEDFASPQRGSPRAYSEPNLDQEHQEEQVEILEIKIVPPVPCESRQT